MIDASISCRRTPLVPKEKIYELLKKMPNWKLRTDEKAISRQFSTKDFVAALKFLNQAGEVAEEEGTCLCVLYLYDLSPQLSQITGPDQIRSYHYKRGGRFPCC